MENNDLMLELHDKVTRGIALSYVEKTKLEAWYREQDEIESAELSSTAATASGFDGKEQIQNIFNEISESKQRISSIVAQNEILRRENEVLRKTLTENRDLKVA
jgi:hypothetical protein